MTEGVSSEDQERLHKARYSFATRFSPNQCILDVACGTGYGSEMLAQAEAREVVGCDYALEALALARERHSHPEVRLCRADATHLPFRTAEFDLCVSFETVEHVPIPADFIRELHRVCKPGGLLIMSTPNRRLYSPGTLPGGRPWNPFHSREFVLGELVAMLETTGFLVVERYGQLPVNLLWARFRDALSRYETLRALMDALYQSVRKQRAVVSDGASSEGPSGGGAVVPLRAAEEPTYYVLVSRKSRTPGTP